MLRSCKWSLLLLILALWLAQRGRVIAAPAAAPAIVATTPNHNSIERNDRITPLTATFAAPIDPATLAANVTLWSAGTDGVVPSADDVALASGVSYDAGNQTATVTPAAPLADDLYLVRYGTGISAPDATPLAAQVEVAFRVRTPVTWLGTVNLLWGTAGNWSSGAVPGANDYVIVDQSPATLTINLNSSVQAAGTLEIVNPNATVSHNSGGFTITDDVINYGRFQIGGPTGNTTLTNGNFYNFGTLRSYLISFNSARLSVATLYNDGLLLVEDVFSFNRANTVLINTGTVDILAAGRLELSASAPTYIQTAGSITIASGGSFRNATNSSMTLQLLGGSYSGSSSDLYGVALTIGNDMTFVNNAVLTVRGVSTLTGNLPAGLTLWLKVNGDLHWDGDWHNAGTLLLGPGAYGGTPYARLYNATGTLTNDGLIVDTVHGGSGDSDRATLFANIVNNGVMRANLWFKLRGVGKTLTNNGTIDLVGNDRDFIVENGFLVNNGVIQGDGRLRFAGTAINTVGGTLRPGGANRAAKLTMYSGLAQTAASVTDIEIGGVTADTLHDQLYVTGSNFTLDGTLNVSVINGFDPAPGQSFLIVGSNRTRLSQFATVNGLQFSARKAFTLEYLSNGVRLTTVATPITVTNPGDAADANPADGLCDVNLNNPGAQCTLRAAIEVANALAGPDAISFALPAGSTTIAPTSALPPISDPVTIDGSTQGSACPQPGVTLDGVNAGADVSGLTLTTAGGGSTLRGLHIVRFSDHGIDLDHSDGNTIVCSWIGTDAAGANQGNTDNGIFVDWSRSNTIGGTAAADRNVIGRNNTGLAIVGNSSAENVVLGNLIGLAGADANGAPIAAPNIIGVTLDTAQGNTIGGTAAGAGNTIGRNANYGVYIVNVVEPGNVVQGNRIGTTPDGLHAAGNGSAFNGGAGILIEASAANQIGGTQSGAGNLISANASGLAIRGTYSTGNIVEGNLIGTDATGSAPLGNLYDGVVINNAPSNRIGGTAAGAANVISANADNGIVFTNLNAAGNLIQGNRIGTTADGSAALGNGNSGIRLNAPATANTIGGTAAGAGNVISANGEHGILLAQSAGNTVQGNLIGSNAAGSAALGNANHGIMLDAASNNTIGGTTAGARNVISGNRGDGLRWQGPDYTFAMPNTVQGNWIGLTAAGTAALPNENGVLISSGGSLTLGGTAAGAGNVISGNRATGVVVGSASGVDVQGNRIGTDPAGLVALGNQGNGVWVSAPLGNGVTIGGTAAGAGNIISGNAFFGVQLADTPNTALYSNLIGVAADGVTALGNGGHGVLSVDSAPRIGNNSGAANVIGGNGGFGIRQVNSVDFGTGFRPTLIGNAIGMLADGTLLPPNADGGLFLSGGAGSVEENSIGNNDGPGIAVTSGSFRLSRNLVRANHALGIDLGVGGVTPNDAGDGDAGGNQLLNFPTITGVSHSAGTTVVNLSYSGLPNSDITVELFSVAVCDPAGHGEGGSFLQSKTLTTNANGDRNTSITLPYLLPADQFVAATATYYVANLFAWATSEFSNCAQIGEAAGAISGSATGAGGPLADALVTLYRNISDSAWPQWAVQTTQPVAANGTYSFANLARGSYALRFVDQTGGYAPELYDNVGTFAALTPIPVTPGATTTVPLVTLDGGGTLAGSVSGTARAPLAGIQVVALLADGSDYTPMGSTTTAADGSYALAGLPPGSYRLYFSDPAAFWRSVYYGNAIALADATPIALAEGQTVGGRNADLIPLDALIDFSTDDPAITNPCTVEILADGQIIVRRTTDAPACEIVLQTPPGMVACPDASAPTYVAAFGFGLFPDNEFALSEVTPGVYRSGVITLAGDPAWGATGGELQIAWICAPGIVHRQPIGSFSLYDPSGFVRDALSNAPVVGASVTLYQVPGWSARTAPGQTTPATCESNVSKPAGAPWSQPAPVALGVAAAPLPSLISPQQTTQLTDATGHYGWDVAAGCWYVVVSAPGYVTLVSPVVGVPPEVTDLDLRLTPDVPTAVAMQAVATDAGGLHLLALWLTLLPVSAYALAARRRAR